MSLTTLGRLSAAVPVLSLLLSAAAAAQPYPAPLRVPYTVPLPDDNFPPPQAYPAPPAEQSSEQPSEHVTGTPGTTSPLHAVSLRAGPSGASPVIGTLRAGMPVEIVSTASPGWLQVRSAAGEGWAWGAFFPGGAGATAKATSTAHSAGALPSEIISP